MSNFYALTKRSHSKETEVAEWLDDYYGPHRFGVRFPDGKVYRSESCRFVEHCEPDGKTCTTPSNPL